MSTIFISVVPNATRVSSPFAEYRSLTDRPHNGVDIVADAGSPIYSPPVDGVVVANTTNNKAGQFGNYMVIRTQMSDGTPVFTVYGHLQEMPINPNTGNIYKSGDAIPAQTQFGSVGNSGFDLQGKPYHVHLHYEERIGTPGQPDNWKRGALAVDPSQNYFGFTGPTQPSSPTVPAGILAQLKPLFDQLNAMRNGLYDNGTQCVPLTDAFLSGIQKLFHQAEIARSPLVLDLNGDGVGTVALNAGVHFDHNSNRFSELSGWVAPSDGLLVRDLNGNGQVDGGGELFGDNTLLANGQKAANGFAALAELDANHDGIVNSAEASAAGVKLWKDANQNGLTDPSTSSGQAPGELLTLNQAGVSSLAIGAAAASTVDAQGNIHRLTGSYTTSNGVVRAMDDVWLASDTARTIEKDTVTVSTEIAALPDIAGFGNVHSLHQAMARDTTGHLQTLVKQFMVATDVADRKEITTQLIYAWAGVENVDPNSRAASMIYGNVIGDARKLASLEALLGESYIGVWCWGTSDPKPHGAAANNDAWRITA